MRIDQQVRLSTNVIAAISRIFLEHFLPNDKLWLFGSRVVISKKGGDIDLYIETNIDIYDIAFDKKIVILVFFYYYLQILKLRKTFHYQYFLELKKQK